MLESAIEASAVKKARRAGWRSVKIGFSGLPDRQFFQRRIYIWIEFKRPGNGLSPLQRVKFAELEAAGELAYVARSADECMGYLNEHSWWLNDHGL